MLDVLLLCYNGWANTGWKMFKVYQSMGLKVMGFKGLPHLFFYPEQLVILPEISNTGKALTLNPLVKQAKVVHYIATTFIDTGNDLSKKFCVVSHGGKQYRQDPEAANKLFNQFVDVSIIQTPDMLGFGAKNEKLVYFPVDTNFIKPIYRERQDVTIGHFPSHIFKGSSLVTDVARKVGKKHSFRYRTSDGSQLVWLGNMENLATVDIYVDQMLPTVKYPGSEEEKVLGTWGNASMEAAAMGKIPISSALFVDTYRKEYGCDPAVEVANDAEELYEVLERLITMPLDEFRAKQENARRWAVENHSFEATGRRLKERIYGDFFNG